MKKYLPIILLLLIVLILPSCVGIGDGALFDNITTGEKKESGVPAPESAALCQIYPGMSPSGTVTTKSLDALELFLNLSSGNYTTDVDRTTVEKPYYELIYQGTEDKHYIIYEDDFVFEKIANTNSESATYISLGNLTGAYAQTEEVYLDTLNAVTDEERDAGFKLNCLQVEMKPEISRTFILSDFEDIGGFYLVQLPAFESSTYYVGTQTGSVMVYFKSCTPGELEEKIALLKKNSVVKSVEKIVLVNLYSE